MDHDKIIDKIRKLLRLSHSQNPHEAALAAKKVQQMLSQYNLTLEGVADGEIGGGGGRAWQTTSKTRKKLEGWAHVLAGRTAYTFDCRYFHNPDSGETVFVGVGADPEVCGWMYGYLYKSLLRLASKHMRGPARRLRTAKSKRDARESFLFGAVDTIAYRMAAQKRETPTTSSALVPVKDKLIQAAMPRDITTRDLRPHKPSVDHRFYGVAAAEGVSLSTPVTDGGRGQQGGAISTGSMPAGGSHG